MSSYKGSSSDLKTGQIIRFNGELVQVFELDYRNPGNLRAFYQAKMKNVKSGKNVEYRFRADEEVEFVRIDYRKLQYSWRDGENLVLMDNQTYEQFYIPETMFGDGIKYLKEGETEVTVGFEDETPITLEPPTFVILKVVYCEPSARGDTVSNVMKPATMETGAIVSVPAFITEGEVIKVDTRTHTYVERVK